MKQLIQKHRTELFWGFLFLIQLLIFLSLEPYTEIDTASYFVDPFAVNLARTPVYPFMIWLCKLIAGTHWPQLICILQFAVSFLSCTTLYSAFRLLHVGERGAKIAILLYGLNIAVFPWNGILLTESFSLSLTAIYVYFCALLTCKAENNGHYFIQVLGISVLTIVMTFLRPTFAVLVPISCFLCIYAAIKRKILCWQKIAAVSFLFLAIFSCIFGYAYRIKENFGYFTLSSILTSQQYCQAIQQGLHLHIAPNSITSFIEAQGPEQDPLLTGYEIVAQFPPEEVQATLKEIIQNDFLPYVGGRVQAYAESVSLPFGRRPHYGSGLWTLPGLALSGISYVLLPPIPFGTAAPLALAGLVVLVLVLRKKKEFDMVLFGSSFYVLLTIGSTMFGTMDDYARTAISCFPFLFILVLRSIVLLKELYFHPNHTAPNESMPSEMSHSL